MASKKGHIENVSSEDIAIYNEKNDGEKQESEGGGESSDKKEPKKWPPDEEMGEGQGAKGSESHDSHTSDLDDQKIWDEIDKAEKERGDSDKGEGGKVSDVMDEMDKSFKDLGIADNREETKNSEDINNKKESQSSGGTNDKAMGDSDKASGNIQLSIQPVNWKNLLKRLASKIIVSETTTTYAKPHVSSAGSASLAVDVGGAVVKPSEVTSTENKQKLIFVIDNSGSMDTALSKVHSQVMSMLKREWGDKEDTFYVIKFSNTAHTFKCSVKHNSAKAISLNDIWQDDGKPASGGTSLTNVFSTTFGGGTFFSPTLVHSLVKATKNGDIVIAISDADLLYGDNLGNLGVLLKTSAPDTVGVVFDTDKTYDAFTKTEFGNKYRTKVSYVD